ncbi:MAG TPA: uroporphyrinogen-III synthase [Terriglobales bacterium]|jgi:uroporphyrinogen-III synthase
MKSVGFSGLRVLSLESRRAREIAHLIQNNGGESIIAPSTREVPLAGSPEVGSFVTALLEGQFQAVIFLTGVGARALAEGADAFCPRKEFVAALGRVAIIARGPKPVAALRELGVTVTLNVPEPNTWREILQVLDANVEKVPVQGRSIAIQEHGAPSKELLEGLAERGAIPVPVHVYEWALPEDKAPLKAAVAALIHKEIDIVLFTASVQLQHLLEVAAEMKQRDELLRALKHTVVASIGPTTTQTLKTYGIDVDMEPTHPRMGFLVKETAERSAELVHAKRAR